MTDRQNIIAFKVDHSRSPRTSKAGSPILEVRQEVQTKSVLDSLNNLEKLEELPFDWGRGEMDRPNETAIQLSKKLIADFDSRGLAPSRISASAEGGVTLGFQVKTRYAGIEVENNGSVIGLVSDNAGAIQVWEVDPNTLEETAERIREHLSC